MDVFSTIVENISSPYFLGLGQSEKMGMFLEVTMNLFDFCSVELIDKHIMLIHRIMHTQL